MASTPQPSTPRIAVAGFGYWGPNIARNVHLVQDAELAAVCDASEERRAAAAAQYPGVRTTADLDDVLGDPDIDAVVVATPAGTHHALARRVLDAGKHVLVEKPLAMTVAEGRELVEQAEAAGRILMVGHTFLYNSAVRWLRSFVDSGELGTPYYLYAQRLNLGQVRRDVNVLWNLAPHDVSVLMYLLDDVPTAVTAHGSAYVQPGTEDVAFLLLEFPGGRIGHVHVSWLDPRKVRRFTVVGSRKMVVYDDVDVDARIQVYDKGVDVVDAGHENLGEFQMLVRSGDLLVPRLDFKEPLRVECEAFAEAVRTGTPPLTDGRHALQVLAVLEAAQHSLEKAGERVPVAPL